MRKLDGYISTMGGGNNQSNDGNECNSAAPGSVPQASVEANGEGLGAQPEVAQASDPVSHPSCAVQQTFIAETTECNGITELENKEEPLPTFSDQSGTAGEPPVSEEACTGVGSEIAKAEHPPSYEAATATATAEPAWAATSSAEQAWSATHVRVSARYFFRDDTQRYLQAMHIDLQEGYANIKQQVMKRFERPVNAAIDYQLFLEDEDCMSREVADSSHGHALEHEHFVTVNQIKRDATIYLRHIKDNVGPKQSLEVMRLMNRYNRVLSDKISELREVYGYKGWRHIRGDGNCYFRAVLFGLIEYLIASHQLERLGQLAECFAMLKFEGGENYQHEAMVQRIRYAVQGKVWGTAYDFEAEILRPDLDEALIRACRRLVGQFILHHASQDFNGLSLNDAIMASYTDVRDLDQYVHTYIYQLGTDVEGTFVHLGVLFHALQCVGRTVVLDRRHEVEITTLDAPLGLQEDSSSLYSRNVDVHLLLRPGHYDLLYHSTWPQ